MQKRSLILLLVVFYIFTASEGFSQIIFKDIKGIESLEWLELSKTEGMSRKDVEVEFKKGGRFENWRYASKKEALTLYEALIKMDSKQPNIGYLQEMKSAPMVAVGEDELYHKTTYLSKPGTERFFSIFGGIDYQVKDNYDDLKGKMRDVLYGSETDLVELCRLKQVLDLIGRLRGEASKRFFSSKPLPKDEPEELPRECISNNSFVGVVQTSDGKSRMGVGTKWQPKKKHLFAILVEGRNEDIESKPNHPLKYLSLQEISRTYGSGQKSVASFLVKKKTNDLNQSPHNYAKELLLVKEVILPILDNFLKGK